MSSGGDRFTGGKEMVEEEKRHSPFQSTLTGPDNHVQRAAVENTI